MSDFRLKKTTVKGTYGEDVCFEYLRRRGHTVYRPDRDDRAHPFDTLLVHGQSMEITIADVKTKPRREAYPDTGINERHFCKYTTASIRNKLRVFLFFVDETEGRIYGNFLDILTERHEIVHNGKKEVYPKNYGGIVYFPLEKMKTICWIPDDEISKLKEMRNTSFRISNPAEYHRDLFEHGQKGQAGWQQTCSVAQIGQQ